MTRKTNSNNSRPSSSSSYRSLALVSNSELDQVGSDGCTSVIITTTVSTLEAQNSFLDSQLVQAEAWRASLEERRQQLEEKKLDAQTRRQFEGQMSRYDEELERLHGELHSISMRDVRVKEGFDSMCHAVPRFLTKLTRKTCQPSETLEEVRCIVR